MIHGFVSRVLPKLVDVCLDHTLSAVLFLILAGLLFIPFEQLLPVPGPEDASMPKRRIERFADVLHALLNPVAAGITATILGLVFQPRGLERILRKIFDTDVPAFLSWDFPVAVDLPMPVHFFGALLLSSVAGYWVHRALHEWSFLWRFHAVHHSSERVDWLSAHRQHPLEVVLLVVATVVPSLLIGLRPEAIAGVFIFRKLHQFFSHSHTRLPLGPLRFVVVTPRHHHWHHEVDARCNYAGLFPWLDMLFGTYRDEGRFPERTGASSHVHKGYLSHLVHPLRRPRFVDSRTCHCRTAREGPLYGRDAEWFFGAQPRKNRSPP